MWQYESKKKKKSSQVSACSVGWRILLCSIRVAFDGKYWMERPAFYLWDRKNKSKKGKKRRRETDSGGERELGVRVREARELRERSWQELPLGPVPVFQRKCRRPNLWPPEMGDLVAPAYCPVYHLLLLMGLSSYWTGTSCEKEPQETKKWILSKIACITETWGAWGVPSMEKSSLLSLLQLCICVHSLLSTNQYNLYNI